MIRRTSAKALQLPHVENGTGVETANATQRNDAARRQTTRT